MTEQITIRKPADMHQHFRQDHLLKAIAPLVAERFSIAIAMPNTKPPVTTLKQVRKYRREITSLTGEGFKPLMTLYLTDNLHPYDVAEGCKKKMIVGVKYYPKGLTTNSDSGVQDTASLWTKGSRPYLCLRALAEHHGILLIHAADGVDEDGRELDPYDQERHFIRMTLHRILEAHPDLRVVIEHLSTSQGVHFMERHGGKRIGCTVTAHHLLLDRRDMFRGGLRPHLFCWPVINQSDHREALCQLVSAGHPFVFLGSDSAGHLVEHKESDCCPGGVFTAHAALELYAEIFEGLGILDKLEVFASLNGPRFYGIRPSTETITLEKRKWTVAPSIEVDSGHIRPFRFGETIPWQIVR